MKNIINKRHFIDAKKIILSLKFQNRIKPNWALMREFLQHEFDISDSFKIPECKGLRRTLNRIELERIAKILGLKQPDWLGAFYARASEAGCMPFRFNGYSQEVCIYQISGRHRLYVVHPDHGHKLVSFFNQSTVLPGNIAQGELKSFLRYIRAKSVVLKSGDFIKIPPFFWYSQNVANKCEWFETGDFKTEMNQQLKECEVYPNILFQMFGYYLAKEKNSERDILLKKLKKKSGSSAKMFIARQKIYQNYLLKFKLSPFQPYYGGQFEIENIKKLSNFI